MRVIVRITQCKMLQHHYTLFIGANNTTGEVELDKLTAVLNKKMEGYTIAHSIGFWQGTPEKSVMVHIVGDQTENEIEELASDIRKELEQQCVMMTRGLVSLTFVTW